MGSLQEAIAAANVAIENSKKLSTKTRNKMKDSSFCGPNRSYPISDCAHYTAALRLINRSKFSDATKAKIRSCVMSKGKKMGCPGASDKKKETSSYLTLDMQELYDSPEFASTKILIEESIKKPGMELDFDLVDIDEQE